MERMLQSEQFRRMIRIFALAFLCNELQSNLMIPSTQMAPEGLMLGSEENVTYASIEGSKHHASIRLKALDKTFGEGHICSGALIAPSVVLTAAQCTYDFVRQIQRHPSELRVVMGTKNRYQRMEHTLVYGVTHLYTPPTFDSQSLRDNIAILMLERDIFENSHIESIVIRLDNAKRFIPSDVQVTTWVSTKQGVPLPSLLLFNSTTFSGKNLDSGAPLLLDGELAGLISNDNERSNKTPSIVYIDKRQHQWILEQIGDGTNQNGSFWGTTAFLLFTIFALRKFDFKRRWSVIGL